jgi:NAD+ synthase
LLGNRSELAIGYFTKYGDGGVDLLPQVRGVQEQDRERREQERMEGPRGAR